MASGHVSPKGILNWLSRDRPMQLESWEKRDASKWGSGTSGDPGGMAASGRSLLIVTKRVQQGIGYCSGTRQTIQPDGVSPQKPVPELSVHLFSASWLSSRFRTPRANLSSTRVRAAGRGWRFNNGASATSICGPSLRKTGSGDRRHVLGQ